MSDLNEYMDRMKREDRTAKDKQINQMLGEVGLDSTGTAIPDWQPAKKKEPAAVNQPSTSGLVRSVEDLWLGVREGSAGFYQLGANAFGLMDSAASRISKWTGMPKGGGLGAVSAFLKDAAMQTAPKPQDLEGRDNFISYLYRAIGSAPVTIGTYVAGGSVTGSNIAGMALIDALRHVDEGMWPAVKSGLQGALLGTGLKMIQPFSRPVRAALGGTTFAGLTAAQGGSTPEILAQGVVGGGLAALAPTKTPEIKTDKSQVIEADRPKATPMQDLTTKPSGPTIELPDQTKPKAEGGKTEGKADVELARAMPDLTPEGKPDPVSLKMAEELENAKIEADAYMREKGLTKAYWEVKKNTVDPEARRVVERTEHQLKEEQQYGTVEEQLASDPILKSLVEKPVEPATATTEGTLPQHPMDDMPFFANQIYKAAGELDVTPQAMVNSMKLTSLVETPAARRARLDTPESREAHKKVSEWAKQELEKLKLERQEKTALGELVQGLKKKIVEERGSIPVRGGGEGGGEPKDPRPTTTRQKMLGEGGFSTFDINFAIARTLAGAIYGYSQGDTMEERLKNALIYGTIGSLANPMMIKTIIKSMKGLDPEGIKRIEMRDKGYTPTVAEGFDAAAKDVKKMSEFLRSTNEGIEVKGRVDGINYDHINTPMDVKYTIGKMAKVYQDELNKVRKVEGVPHEELIAQAGKLAETKKGAPEHIYNWPDGKPMTDRELLLTRVMRNDLGKGLHDATAKFLSDNSNTNLIEFIDTFNKYRMVQSVYAGQATGRGRGLEALKINVGNSGEVEFHRMLGDVIESIDPTGWTPQRLAGAIAQVPDINALNRAMEIAARPGMHDMLLEAFYGVSMLSNPKTWVVNMTSAPIAMGWQVAKRSVAAGFTVLQGKVGNPDYVQPNEPLMMMQAIKDSYHDAFIVAKEAFVKGERQYPYTYGGKAGLARPNAITYDNLRALHPEAFNAAEWALSNMGIDAQKLKFGIDLLGNAARVSTRLMLAPDEFNELIGARMELYARTARSTAAEGLSLSETAALAKRKVYSQEGFSNADKEAAKTFALYNTFNQEPGSVTTRLTGVIESLNKSPDIDPVWYLATKAVVPFITIPANIARWAARESGPTAFLSRQLKEQMAKGGAEAQTAWAGVALGSMLLTVAANLAMNGYVTGAAPVQKADRLVWEADGNIEYGAKIPGVGSFGINRIDPIAIPFAWAADFVNLSGHLDAYDGTTLAATALLTLTHDLASKNYVQGVTNFLHAITSQDSKELQTFAKGQTGSLLTPGIVRGIRQETDPYRRATNTTFDAMRQSTPWGSTDYPGVLDRFGRPIYSGYGAGPEWARIFGIINPIQYRAANDSAVIKEVTGNNIPIPGLSDTIYGAKDNPYDNKPLNEKNGIKLEGWEYYLYNKYSGEKLFGLLEREVKTERWRQASPGPTGGKALIFNTLVTAADEYARKKLLDESPELRGAYRQKLEARKEALKPVPGQISVPSY